MYAPWSHQRFRPCRPRTIGRGAEHRTALTVSAGTQRHEFSVVYVRKIYRRVGGDPLEQADIRAGGGKVALYDPLRPFVDAPRPPLNPAWSCGMPVSRR